VKVNIRAYQPEDDGAIQGLIADIMDKEFPQTKAAYPMDDLTHISTVYGGPGDAFFVAVDHHQIVGTVAVKHEDKRVALLRRIFVAPTHRNQKLGIGLIEKAIQFCKDNGYQELVFRTSSKMDRAIRLCQKKNFQQRASLEIGGLELLKFVLFLGNGEAKS